MMKPTRDDLLGARDKTLPDVIAPSLTVLFCGINPGLYTAATGHHFGRPGNRFWLALFESGFTPNLMQPAEQAALIDLGIGITNLVSRATASESELTREEMVNGSRILEEKAAVLRPKWIGFVGIGAYRIGFKRPAAKLGHQAERIGDSGIWVLPSTSGLNANHRTEDFARLFLEFRLATLK